MFVTALLAVAVELPALRNLAMKYVKRLPDQKVNQMAWTKGAFVVQPWCVVASAAFRTEHLRTEGYGGKAPETVRPSHPVRVTGKDYEHGDYRIRQGSSRLTLGSG